MKVMKDRTLSMPRAIRLPVLVLAGLLFALTGRAEAQDCPRDGTLVAGAADYPPYNIVEGTHVRGMDFDVIETILTKMGCNLRTVALPWARHLAEMRNGTVDIATPVTITPERLAFAHFTAPYIHAEEILFVRSEDRNTYTDLSNFFLQGKRLGVIRDYAYGGDYQDLKNAYFAQIEQTDSQELNLKQLSLGRVDAVLGERYVVSSAIQKLGFSEDIKPSTVVVASEPNFIMFSKKSISADFVSAFSKILSDMQENGELDLITSQYLNKDRAIN